MAHHNHDLSAEKNNYFFKPSKNYKTLLLALMGVGALTLVFGFALGLTQRSWGSLLFNTLFFFAISLGGVLFGGMQEVISALWARPIKRIYESFGAFLPVAISILIVFLLAIKFNLLGAGSVYSWIKTPEMLEHFPGKDKWLNPDFMIIRDIGALVLTYLLTRWHLNKTSEGDRLLLASDKNAFAKAYENAAKLKYWSAPILVIHSLTFTLLAFDLTMSLAPTWFSTLWGGWNFAILMQTLFATILLHIFYFKGTPVGKHIAQKQFHDLGKLLFGFSAFYAYLTFAHVLTYWFINMPEETSYFFTRLERPWLYFIIAAPFLSFFIPFVALVPKTSKWSKNITIPVCILVLTAQWINYLLMVIPELIPAYEWGFPWIELGVFLGILGAFLFAFMKRTEKLPLIAITDPLLQKYFKEFEGH